MAERPETDVEKVKRLTRWQRLGLATLFLAGVLVVGGGVFVWSGLYNISARTDHWRITDVIIAQLRDRSIYARADDIEVPDLSLPGLARLGAEHFRTGCATCHGLPGAGRNPVFASMTPAPPDLTHSREDYDVEELFWIIYHGLKYTGMPAWAGRGRSDEVWPLVALVAHLHENGAESFSDLTAQDRNSPCGRCHGGKEAPPISGMVPVLNGQSAAYLARALREYRSGERQSGMMEPLAHELSDAEIEKIARGFAGMQPVPGKADQQIDAETLELGKRLALNGNRQEGIPACSSCHGGTGPDYPSLAGQPARYLHGQLQLFAKGGRSSTGYGAIMTVIARRLSDAEMRAAAGYYSVQTGTANAEPRDD